MIVIILIRSYWYFRDDADGSPRFWVSEVTLEVVIIPSCNEDCDFLSATASFTGLS